ncbi:MAG: ABC transporter permease [Phycisphaeraceae bacterium]|nr:ABC transporter permease [Phycisphaeraceae bacterium]
MPHCSQVGRVAGFSAALLGQDLAGVSSIHSTPVYQILLTRKYLTSKIMPLLAAIAVVLCTAMVLITWSVMGGFLKNLVKSGRTMIGDVAIVWPNVGFAHYEDLIEMLEADPMIEAACPMIESYGLAHLPGDRTELVVIKGVDGPSFDRVTGYAETLYWKPLTAPHPKDKQQRDWRNRSHGLWEQKYRDGLGLKEYDANTDRQVGAAVLGIEVSGYNIRELWGGYTPGVVVVPQTDGTTRDVQVLMFDETITLNLLALDGSGRTVDTKTRKIPVANEFQSGLYDIDKQTVIVNLDVVQDMLNMDQAERIDPDGVDDPFRVVIDPLTGLESLAAGPAMLIDPARVTTVLVRGVDSEGDPRLLAERCREIYAKFAAKHARVPPAENIRISTWEDQNRTLISAVKKETGLVLFIFSFISLTAVILVLAIFWSMVSEKTKDVGVLRSIGASRSGVAMIWISYGLAIGLMGSLLGGALAYAIVLNINPIHDWMGEALGLTIWDPRVYYFVEIPNEVESDKAAIVMLGGVLSSVVGAMIPAIRAACLSPVRALRFE